jgi:WD40 repeat protein
VTVPQADFIAAFDCDATGARLLWAASDNTLALWDLDRDERVVHCRGHTGKVNAVAIVDAGRYAVSCSSDRTLRLWNLARGEVEAALTTDAGLRSLAVAADGRTFAVGDVSGRVHLVRPERGDGSVLSPT